MWIFNVYEYEQKGHTLDGFSDSVKSVDLTLLLCSNMGVSITTYSSDVFHHIAPAIATKPIPIDANNPNSVITTYTPNNQ